MSTLIAVAGAGAGAVGAHYLDGGDLDDISVEHFTEADTDHQAMMAAGALAGFVIVPMLLNR